MTLITKITTKRKLRTKPFEQQQAPVCKATKFVYLAQAHKECFWHSQKIWGNLRLKKLPQEKKVEALKQQNCHFCQKPLLRKKDHCHVTGKFRGAAHNECNLKLRIFPNKTKIPVVFHNLRGYDAHHLMQKITDIDKEINCVANNMENYITFSAGNLQFIDSLNFLQGSLDSLVSATPKDAFHITKKFSENTELLFKKGINPYEYMDRWERFDETQLPPKEKFYSQLNDQHITDAKYAHAQNVWKAFGCRHLGDYHDLYVKTDVTLLADVFENFRQLCLRQYGLDPAHYFTSPGLSWDALLKMTGVELELFTDYKMDLFVERGMRGGISMVS